ncbi:MAG TPA: NCS2 family permease [Candidatus Hydrogenedentes bacterium]|nr:NCS2 family permease [Candidatus Hydrogenedentota bacterium]
MEAIDRYFGIRASGSSFRGEIIGGLTTFATMSYIIFVQPAVLTGAGMSSGYVMLATCLSAAVATLLMGLVARYPFALAAGMGENFLFVYVCTQGERGLGFSWPAGLAIVLLSGVIFLGLSLFQFRARILRVFPDALKNAIGPAIGVFIALVGFQWGRVIVSDAWTMVKLGSLRDPAALVTLGGVALTAALLAWNVRGAILVGILGTAAVGWATGLISHQAAPLNWDTSTFFNLNFGELLQHWDKALLAILLFFFLDLFDTVGTLVGVGKQAGFIGDDGELPRADRAFFSDAAATCAGALFGTSTVTSYIESASGVAAGARTGFASVVTAACFLLAMLAAPFLSISQATVAPALIVVGFLMMAPLRKVKWEDVTESFPAFMTLTMMVFGYGITEGIAMGCISFVVIKTLAGRWREVHPVMYVVALALAARYGFLR